LVITFNKAFVITFITAFFLGWFSLPVFSAAPAALLLVILAIIVLVCRLLGRADAIVVVAGVILGILVCLLIPQLSSAGFGDNGLVRIFLSLWILYFV
jgi:hypothetical protein